MSPYTAYILRSEFEWSLTLNCFSLCKHQVIWYQIVMYAQTAEKILFLQRPFTKINWHPLYGYWLLQYLLTCCWQHNIYRIIGRAHITLCAVPNTSYLPFRGNVTLSYYLFPIRDQNPSKRNRTLLSKYIKTVRCIWQSHSSTTRS